MNIVKKNLIHNWIRFAGFVALLAGNVLKGFLN
jgi:hypothetical protein